MSVIRTKCILFDMDGTLVDSTPGVKKTWREFSLKYGLDAETVTQATHGTRLVDSLRLYCKIDDDQVLHSEVRRFEDEVLAAGVLVLPGVQELLAQVMASPNAKWAIVTSATGLYARDALVAAGVPLPPHLISSDLVTHGKPHPEPYLSGAKACGIDPKDCLVVEDAPSGIRSAKAAGCSTLAVCTSHLRDALVPFEPDFVVEDLTGIQARWNGDVLELQLP